MTIAAFLALAALIVSIMGLIGSPAGTPRWPWAANVATLLLAIAVMIIGFGGKITL
jgi:hypothetical protein